MFIDKVKIYAKAGDGGNGCISFHREKYVAQGGPDGGDGGNGGNIVIKVAEGDNTLLRYKYHKKFIASNGEDGKNKKFHGKTAEDLYLPVPPGTVIRDAETEKVIMDMSLCDEFVLCRGGKGGWGNKHFATPTRQVPRFAKSGTRGQEREVIFELKMIADVGLIGMPNVGKSSILSMISDAKPKIANYHFTTLFPNLGVVKTGEGQGFVVADIPGLIEGASDGLGLGHNFLRHIDRCRLFVHVVDVSGMEGRNPIEDIKLINNELEKYSAELLNRPQIIAANKFDCLDDESGEFIAEFEKFAKEKGYKVIYTSAATGHNIKELIKLTNDALKELPPVKVYEPEIDLYEELEKKVKSFDIEIKEEDGIFFVEAEWLYNIMGSVNFNDRESLMFFQRVLRSKGVIDALEEHGAVDGDTVNIYDFEFEFVK